MGEVYVGRKFRTEFVAGGKEDSGRIGEIISAGKVLDSLGLTPENAGNISVRTGRGMLITVGGRSKGLLAADDIVEVVSFDGEVAKVIGKIEPSSETPMHWIIYSSFPDVNAIVHAHDELVLDNTVRLDIPSTDHFVHYGTPEQAEQVAEALRKGRYVAIAGHGIVSVGGNLSRAMKAVLEFHEKAAGSMG